eukprot:m.135690 g.135690  ORF g.135690 m.135690 type:complete len:533 (+) comp16566_c0_seq1:166-1764(+)
MSGKPAKAIFEFQGDSEQGELSFQVGDHVVVYRQDVGDGWWEGEANGQFGLFPETYVELQEGGAAGGGGDEEGSDWGDNDADWEQEDPAYASAGPAFTDASAAYGSASSSTSASARPTSTMSSGDRFGRTETLKRSVNRFSAFVKAGAEGFMLGTVKDTTIDPNNMIHVVAMSDGLAWCPNPRPQGPVEVRKAGERSKFKGLKHYEAYTIHGVNNAAPVERRHKHFQWLQERLAEKYSCMCVPPLPDKNYLGKYGETFLDKRQEKLEAWLNRVCRHPVISMDVLSLRHFLSCPPSDEKVWKLGKRKAEKDDFVGATFFRLISQDVACPRDSDTSIENFAIFLREMDKTVRKNEEIALSHADRLSVGFKREYARVASGITALGQTFSLNGGQVNGESVRLSMAYAKAGEIMIQISELFAEQPKNDLLPWYDGLREYSALMTQFSDAILSSKSATDKQKEADENDLTNPEEKNAIKARRDIIHTVTLCEMAHFHQQRRVDFRVYMQNYLQAQIDFHQKLAGLYAQAKGEFDKLV